MNYSEIKEKVMEDEQAKEFMIDIFNEMLKDERINKDYRAEYARKIIDYVKEKL